MEELTVPLFVYISVQTPIQNIMLHNNYLFVYSFLSSDFAFPLGGNYIIFIFLFMLGIMYGIVSRI